MINYSLARKGIESLYDGECSVYEMRQSKNEITKITESTPEIVLANEPCRLSFQNIAPAGDSEPGKVVTQIIKLFLAPEVAIKPGSEITVKQNGVTTKYTSSGLPAVYPTHQEVMLEIGGWA